jgi:uncharacterized membrane protein
LQISDRCLCGDFQAVAPLTKPSAEAAAVAIMLYPPDARRRDIDNYNKALCDALMMSSRGIADLVEFRHVDVKCSI